MVFGKDRVLELEGKAFTPREVFSRLKEQGQTVASVVRKEIEGVVGHAVQVKSEGRLIGIEGDIGGVAIARSLVERIIKKKSQAVLRRGSLVRS